MKGLWPLYKKEIQTYFLSPRSYVILGFFALASGGLFSISALDFQNNMASIMTLLRSVLCIFVPLLTMGLFAKEKEAGTMDLLLSSPAGRAAVCTGKYLASLSFFLIMTAVTIVPLLMTIFLGAGVDGSTLSSYLAFLFTGALYLAVSLCISLLSGTQSLSALLSISLLLLLENIKVPAKLMGELVKRTLHLIDFAKIISNEAEAEAGKWIEKALTAVSPVQKLDVFGIGAISWGVLLHIAVLSLFFLLLCVLLLEKSCGPQVFSKAERGKIPGYIKKTKYRRMAVFSLALVLLISTGLFSENLLKAAQTDVSKNSLMSLSAISEKQLKDLRVNTEIYVLAGEEEFSRAYPFMPVLLNAYVRAGGEKIKLHYIDPDKDPSIIKKLDAKGELSAGKGKLVIKSEKRSIALGAADLFRWTELPSQDGGGSSPQITEYRAENAVSSAIQYVASEEAPGIYSIISEDSFKKEKGYDKLRQFLGSEHMIPSYIDLSKIDSVPENASLLFLLNPERDLNARELKMLEEYAEKGGNFWISLPYSNNLFPNLSRLLAEYNIKLTGGRIKETDPTRIIGGDAYLMLADVPSSVLVPKAKDSSSFVKEAGEIGIINAGDENRDTVVIPLVQSSSAAVAEDEGNPEKISESGVKLISAAAEKKLKDTGGNRLGKKVSRLVLSCSGGLYSDEILNRFGNGSFNLNLVLITLEWLKGEENTDKLLIQDKAPLSYAFSTKAVGSVSLLSAIASFALPLAFFIFAALLKNFRKGKYERKKSRK